MRSRLPSIKTITKAVLLIIFASVVIKEIIVYHYEGFFRTSYITGEKYISFAYFMQFILELLFEILAILLVGLALFGKKTVLEENGKERQYTAMDLALALSFSLPFIFLFDPIEKKRVAVSSFSRVIGVGVIGDWDVKRVISNFGIFFCLFAVIFLSVFVCSNRYLQNMLRKNQEVKGVYKAALSVNIGWLGYYIFAYFIYSATNNLYNIGTVLLTLLICFILLYIILRLEISFKTYFLFLISSLGMSYGCCAILFSELEGGRTVAGIWFIVVIFVVLALRWKAARIKEVLCKRINWKIMFTLFAAVPLILSLYIELINILNQWGIFVAHPRTWFAAGMIILTVLFFVLAIVFRRKSIRKSISGLIYIELILGFSCMSMQLNLVNLVYADIFETANSAVLISDFLNFGKIPIVEHYGGHMLSGVVGGILYGIINQDYSNAIYTMYYLATPIVAVLFYKFMQTQTSREMAFMATLFFPYELLWSYFGMAISAVLALAYYLKNRNWKRALALWGIVAGCCLYRLDLGVAVLESSAAVLVFYAIIKKNKKIVKDNLLGGGVVAVFYLILWVVLCLWKDISPIDRLKEFIGVSASNYTWAYSSIGDTSIVPFGWFYLFLPFLVIVSGLLLLMNKKIRELFSEIEWIISINLICMYFFNYSRSLVRHSVVELDATAMAQRTALIYIVLAIFLARVIKNKELCIPFMTIFIVLNSLLIGGKSYLVMPQLYQATSKIEPIVEGWTLSRYDKEYEALYGEKRYTYWEEISNNQTIMNRTVRDESNESDIYELQEVFDTLLKEDETFLDFVSKSFFYSAYGKVDPVYISQTPSMLSNEFTQQQYIKEIAEQYEKIPIAIMPSLTKGNLGFDGVTNSMRYYKVVEYLYQNYRPLCMANGYSLWCANDRFEDMLAKVQGVYETIDWEYESKNHAFNLQKLPYIWANYDEKKAINNSKIVELASVSDNVYYLGNVADIEKGKGNYLMLSISSNMDQEVTLSAGNRNNPELSIFTFDVCGGENSYLIRISSDYYWYNNSLDYFTISAGNENGLISGKLSILEGD